VLDSAMRDAEPVEEGEEVGRSGGHGPRSHAGFGVGLMSNP